MRMRVATLLRQETMQLQGSSNHSPMLQGSSHYSPTLRGAQVTTRTIIKGIKYKQTDFPSEHMDAPRVLVPQAHWIVFRVGASHAYSLPEHSNAPRVITLLVHSIVFLVGAFYSGNAPLQHCL